MGCPMFFFLFACSMQAITLDPRLEGEWVISDVQTNAKTPDNGEHKGWILSFHNGTSSVSTNTGKKFRDAKYMTWPTSKKDHGILVAVVKTSDETARDGMLYKVEKEKLVFATHTSITVDAGASQEERLQKRIPAYLEIKPEDWGKDKEVIYLERKQPGAK